MKNYMLKRFSNLGVVLLGSFAVVGCAPSFSRAPSGPMPVHSVRSSGGEGVSYTCQGTAQTPKVEKTGCGHLSYLILGYVENRPTLDAARAVLQQTMATEFPEQNYEEECSIEKMQLLPTGALSGTSSQVSVRKVTPTLLGL